MTPPTNPRLVRRALPLLLGVPLLAAGLGGSSARAATAGDVAVPVPTKAWEVYLDPHAPIALSSPTVATLAGEKVAVVGDLAGRLYAVRLDTGAELAGWPASTAGAPIESSPSVAGARVFVGAGSAGHPDGGGYYAFSATGRRLWHRTVPWTPSVATPRGVVAGLTVGRLQGRTALVAGSLGQWLEELSAANGATLPGFPWFEADTVFSTAALATIPGHGTVIVEGGDSTAGNAFNVAYSNGGHLRILAARGHAGSSVPSSGLLCQYDTSQVVQGSPAVGPFLAGDRLGIVAGTGTFYAHAADSDTVLAVDTSCRLAWKARLDGATTDAPALVDALGTGHLEVAEGTAFADGRGGSVYLLDGATGHVLWRQGALGAVEGGIVSADLGTGHQDLIVPTTHGTEVLDGATGAVVAVLQTVVGEQSSPLVTDDPSGAVGVTVAGYKAGGIGGSGQAVVEHFVFPGTTGSAVGAAGSWPEFHHDPQLSGAVAHP